VAERENTPFWEGLITIVGVLSLPLVIVFTPFWGMWAAIRTYLDSEGPQERKAKEQTHALYQRALALSQAGAFPDKVKFGRAIVEKLPEQYAPYFDPIVYTLLDLYDAEVPHGDVIPPPPPQCDSIEGGRYRDFLNQYIYKHSNQSHSRIAVDVIVRSFRAFIEALPEPQEDDEALFSTPITTLIRPHELIEDLLRPYFEPQADELFKDLRRTLERNVQSASGAGRTKNARLIPPSEYDGDDVVHQYLRNTPFEQLFNIKIPLAIPAKKWFEHAVIWGTPGKGKTTLIQALIANFLPAVARGEASIFLMDSQGSAPKSLIHSVSNLKEFAPGGSLHGRLIYVEPDPTNPIAMNPFLMGRDRDKQYTARDREQLHNQTIELLAYIFSAQGENAAFTNNQAILYRWTIELLLLLPNPNLTTFLKIMTEGVEPYKAEIAQLSEAGRTFFEKQFNQGQFKDRRPEVAARISGILQNKALAAMFDAATCKLDLFIELSKGRVIIVDTDKNYLGDDRCTLYGRIMLALLLRASQERTATSDRKPVYCFIDEAADYLKADPKFTFLIDQARKSNVAMICASQRTGHIQSPNVLDALSGVSIHFVSTNNDSDAHKFASIMHTSADFLRNQPEYHFALTVDRFINRAVSVRVPLTLSTRQWMTHGEFDEIKRDMHARYSDQPPSPSTQPPPNSPTTPPATPSTW